MGLRLPFSHNLIVSKFENFQGRYQRTSKIDYATQDAEACSKREGTLKIEDAPHSISIDV
jgi:hypothetical protein